MSSNGSRIRSTVGRSPKRPMRALSRTRRPSASRWSVLMAKWSSFVGSKVPLLPGRTFSPMTIFPRRAKLGCNNDALIMALPLVRAPVLDEADAKGLSPIPYRQPRHELAGRQVDDQVAVGLQPALDLRPGDLFPDQAFRLGPGQELALVALKLR